MKGLHTCKYVPPFVQSKEVKAVADLSAEVAILLAILNK
jgi:hypothetical protein